MKKTICFIFVSLLVLCLVLFMSWYLQKPYRCIEKADLKKIKEACTSLIENRISIRNDIKNMTFISQSDIFLKPGGKSYELIVPECINELDPQYILIREYYVLIYLKGPPRATLLCFNEGSNEFGTRKLIDGVWFWNGEVRDGMN